MQRFAEFFGILQEVALREGELPDHEGAAVADEGPQPEGRVVAHGVDRNQTPHHGHRRLAYETARENDAIDLPALDFAGDLDALRNLDAALESVVHVVLDEYRGARRSGGVHHLLEAHAHEAHPVVERAAVFVVPVVGVGRQELRNEVAVPGVHLHRVESGGMSCSHGLAEVFGNLHYFVPAHFADGGVGV